MLKELSGKTIALIGGSGFLGTVLANRLERSGARTRVLTRDREHARGVWSLPNTTSMELDVYDPVALRSAIAGADAVVNLVGILNERGDNGRGFTRAHVDLTAVALGACADAKVPRYVHLSALNASLEAPSHYLKTKGQAEALVASSPLDTTILRPSVMFGAGDGLFTRFAHLLGFFLVLPLAGANTRFQPVYVGDVADVILRTLARRASTHHERFDLGGPEILTLREIVAYTARCAGHQRLIVPLPAFLARLQAEICEHLPGKPFSRDNWRSLHVDSIVTGEDGLKAFGIAPTPIRTIVPTMLQPRDRYADLREKAGRPDR
jgi:uncharacterized protein YbjT (DUF2867 family)